MGEKLFAFVLMPFDKEFGDTYLLGIKSTVEEFDMHAERVDEQVFHREWILERIYNQIDVADLIIADMSGRNPNVFYEVGYAHAKNKVCLLLTKDTADIPFDLKNHRHIVYRSILDLKKKLYKDLLVVRDELAKRERPISVELRSIGAILTKDKYFATAEVTICLDLHNRTSWISPDINGIYFYTGSNWRFRQDKQECPQSETSEQGFKLRHFIQAPMPRLPKGGWGQVKLIGEKTVGTAFKGEQLKDSYELTGVALLRVSTARGDFDSPINLKVVADEFPF